MTNRGTATATSVHVYSPPHESMACYERRDDGALVTVGLDGGWEDQQSSSPA